MADWLDTALRALSYPQRKVKEAVSGDELEWFSPDGLNPHVYAAGNTILDLIADPLNLVPVGLLGKGAKAAKAAGHTKGSGKGLLTGSTSNYIPNYYGLTDGAAQLTKAEQVAVDQLVKRQGLDPKQALALVRKAKGMGTFATQGVKGAIQNLVSPKARALHKEQGINPHVQGVVRDIIGESPTPRDLERASANVNYLSHIDAQSGRRGPMNPVAREIAERSNLETYTPNEPGTLKNWMQKNAGTEKTGEAVKLSDETAQHLEDYILRKWGGADTVVMKRARSGTGGNHFNDMYGGKLAPVGPIREAIMRSPDDLAGFFQKQYPNGGDNWKLGKMNDDGSVWLESRGRNVGSAVTEGGVNWTMKVDPDGTLMSVISDKHDFLEKTPGLGRALGEALPNDLVAVTPPMFANIKKIRKKQFKDDVPERAVSGVQRQKKSKEAPVKRLLEEFVEAAPSPQGVQAERLKQAGLLSTAPALYQE
jgi:hypothetical protein